MLPSELITGATRADCGDSCGRRLHCPDRHAAVRRRRRRCWKCRPPSTTPKQGSPAVSADLERNRFALAAAQARRAEAQERADTALDRLHESDARLAAVAERLGHLNSVLRSAVGESERLGTSLAKAEANIVAEQEALQAAAARLDAAREAPEDEEPSPELRDALALAASAGAVGRDGGQACPCGAPRNS